MGWSHEYSKKIFSGGAGTGSTNGAGAGAVVEERPHGGAFVVRCFNPAKPCHGYLHAIDIIDPIQK